MPADRAFPLISSGLIAGGGVPFGAGSGATTAASTAINRWGVYADNTAREINASALLRRLTQPVLLASETGAKTSKFRMSPFKACERCRVICCARFWFQAAPALTCDCPQWAESGRRPNLIARHREAQESILSEQTASFRDAAGE